MFRLVNGSFSMGQLLRDLGTRDGREERRKQARGIKPSDAESSFLNPIKEMAVSNDKLLQSRRNAPKCMPYGGAGTLFMLAAKSSRRCNGAFTKRDLAGTR